MPANAARAAVREAIAMKSFPPVISYPERQRNAMLSAWFDHPTITWVPEVLSAGRLPVCTTVGCKCTPKVKEYLQRTVHDVEHKTILYYARYRCSTGRSFSTIDDAYIASSKAVLLAFPYLLTYQTSILLDLFDLVYDSMLTTKGLAGATDNVTRRRQKRYYSLLVLASHEIEKRKALNAGYAAPLLQSVGQYMTNHLCLDSEALQKVWLTQTEVCTRLLEAQMAGSQCQKVIRLDHSQKFCSKLKVFGSDGSNEQASSVRMLLLVQNEIGQVMARGLTRSENHDETEAILQSVAGKLSERPAEKRFCVCDHANGMRNLINKLFGESVDVKQDPFHVIQRLTEKISDQAQRGSLSKRLAKAIYDVERNIRSPSTTAEMFATAISSVPASSIRVSSSEWEGCVNSNLEQIRQGDLFVEESDYNEGGSTVRVVSTSQLEAIHSKLRKLLDRVLSIEVGLRILDVFLLQHNLKVGAKFKRNPEFDGFDFITLSCSAVLCRGTIPDSPQLEYFNVLLTTRLDSVSLQHKYRPGGGEGPAHRPWEALYDMIPLHPEQAEGNLLRDDTTHTDIRKLLFVAKQGRTEMTQRDFVENLGLEAEYDSPTEFTSHEFALLKLLRAEQLAGKVSTWESCEVVATILYNTAVRQLDNPNLDIKKRGFRAIARRLGPIDLQIKQSSEKLITSSSRVLVLKGSPRLDDESNSPKEKALQEELFELLRLPVGIKHVKQVYRSVYDFAAYTCAGVNRKSDEFLERRWDSLRRAVSYKRRRVESVEPINPLLCSRGPANSSAEALPPAQIADKNSAPSLKCSMPVDVPTKHPPLPAPAPVSVANPGISLGPSSRTKMQYEVLDDAILNVLLEYAATFRKGTHGKWSSIVAKYKQLNPSGSLDLNKLRCRLNAERKRRAQRAITECTSISAAKPASEAVTPSVAPVPGAPLLSQTANRAIPTGPACSSCNKRKRGCGPNSTNPNCAHRQTTPMQSITRFFTE